MSAAASSSYPPVPAVALASDSGLGNSAFTNGKPPRSEFAEPSIIFPTSSTRAKGKERARDQDPAEDEDADADESLPFGFRDHLLPLTLSSSAAAVDVEFELEEYDAAYEREQKRRQRQRDKGRLGEVGYGTGADDNDEDEFAEEEIVGADTEQRRQNRRLFSSGRLSRLHPSSPSRSPSSRARAPPERRMTLFDGVALTVGLQIGSGIFSSPGVVTLNAGSVGASLSVWLLSGLLAWTGAASFAELGAAIPLNGGAQAYLTYSFGELAGYLFAWIAITALKPGSGAIIASIFAEYVARIAYHAKAHASASISNSATTAAKGSGASESQAQTQPELQDIPPWLIKLIALALTVLLSTLHALSTRLSTRFQNISTALKLLALFAVPVAAGVQVARRGMPEQSHAAFGSWDGFWKGSARSPGAYALALYSGLWSFDGWDQVSLVGGEMKNVKRDLPRVIHISLCLVLMIFLLVVTSYFLVLPPALVARTNTVALDFGAAILGPSGGVVFALLVAFSCLGALNSQFYTTARLVYVAAREGYLPSVFARLHARTRTPLNAIVLQNVLVALFLLFGSGFASIVNFYGVCSWLFYFATVSGLLVLRVKEPNLERPYKTYLSTPILFSAVALFLLFMPIFSAPLEALAAFVFISAGVPMYYLTQQRRRASGRISHADGVGWWRRWLPAWLAGRGAQADAGADGRGDHEMLGKEDYDDDLDGEGGATQSLLPSAVAAGNSIRGEEGASADLADSTTNVAGMEMQNR